MTPASPTRREFLAASAQLLGSGWVTLHLPLLTGLAACASDAARRGEPFTTLTADEAAAFSAIAARILPSDESGPGATEAGVVYFADRALGSFFDPMLPVIREGLRDLDARAGGSFAALAAERQDELLREIEQTPFFFSARLLAVAGFFADPEYGGNRDGAAMRFLAIEPHAAHAPPFGWYDAEYAKGGAG